jgi:hypothetical protein
VPPTTTFHVLTALFGVVSVGVAALGVREGGWLLWLMVSIAVACFALVVNRVRARVVVTADRIDIGHELGTRRIARHDVEDLEIARDGLGWAPRLVMRDGTHHRIECLAAFQREEAALALGELRFAADSVRDADGAA